MDRKLSPSQRNQPNEDVNVIHLNNTLSGLMTQTPPIPLI